jgi:CheY-like chemotaxis protein
VRSLIADGSEEHRRRLWRLLRDAGILDIVQAPTIEQALWAARLATPDLIVLDLELPGGSALATVPWLKTLQPSPTVFVLTGVITPRLRAACRDAGADAFFDKSDDEELAQMIGMLGDLDWATGGAWNW